MIGEAWVMPDRSGFIASWTARCRIRAGLHRPFNATAGVSPYSTAALYDAELAP